LENKNLFGPEEGFGMEIIIFAVVMILDQGTKYMARLHLMNAPGGTVPVFEGVFHLTYRQNTGAAFSILSNYRWVLVAVTLIACSCIVYYLYTHRNLKLFLRIGLALVLAGALGNLVDRAFVGYVVDFFDFRLINFAVFNVADCAIVSGCIMTGIYLLFMEGKHEQHKGMHL
jgi:signal peptidase II